MKGTELFKQTIENYLQVRANADEQFGRAFLKEGKSIDGCVNFILNKVKESGCNGFADEEIFGLAVHYYDEDDISEKDTKPVNCNVVVNHHVELTEEEKQEAREKAKRNYEQAEQRRIENEKRKAEEKTKKAQERRVKKNENANQLTLF